MSGTWSAEEVAGKPADVYNPPGPLPPRFGVLYLHGADIETLKGHKAFTRQLAAANLVCVCPHCGRCWWADRNCPEFDPRITPERHVVDAVVPFFRERWGLGPPALALLGVGMGGQGALRLAFRHPRLFPVAVALAPALEYHELYGAGTALDTMYDSKEHCRQDTALMHVPPAGYPPHLLFASDPADQAWHRGSDRLHEKLKALGIPHEIDFSTRSGAAPWEYFDRLAPRAFAFLEAGLVHESRRLL
jgi:S-formylglutathione hydrolase